jgi:hypothetical protein
MQRATASSSWTVLLPGFVVAGIGIGLANPAIAKIALGVVAPNRSGMASGISNTFRVGGVAVGIAALGAIFTARLGSELHAALPGAGSRLADLISAGGMRAAAAFSGPTDRARTLTAARHAFVTAFDEIALIGAVIVLLGSLFAFALVRERDFGALPASAPG